MLTQGSGTNQLISGWEPGSSEWLGDAGGEKSARQCAGLVVKHRWPPQPVLQCPARRLL